MVDATVAQTTVEAMEAAVQTTAPAVATGTLDYKKVALFAGGVVVVGVGTYFCVKAIKKRKAKSAVVVAPEKPVVDPTLEAEVAE